MCAVPNDSPEKSVKDKAEKEEVPSDEFQELLRRANGLVFWLLDLLPVSGVEKFQQYLDLVNPTLQVTD